MTVDCKVSARIPTTNGIQRCLLYTNTYDSKEHLAILFGPYHSTSLESIISGETGRDRACRGANSIPIASPQNSTPLVRVHSSCLTGETLGSLRCDCSSQLSTSLALLSLNGGILIYLFQEGRDIGLLDKLLAYNLIDLGHDTYSANIELGHPPDARSYLVASEILTDLGVKQVNLLTNNPDKRIQLERDGIIIKSIIPVVPPSWKKGVKIDEQDTYLITKILKMGHTLPIPNFLATNQI